MWLLYSISMYFFVLGIRISAMWNPKSGQWLSGRKNWVSDLKKIPLKNDFRIWFHVSSLGEFEQARPVIEKIKELRSGTEIILSFFSPSGFLQKRDYPYATVLYLPADLPGNAKLWIQIIDPDFAVFTKYDLWPGYLKALSEKKIPAILISANWIPGTISSWSNPLINGFLKEFKKIFLQRKDHLTAIQNLGFSNTQVSGDTRIDRSLELPAEVEVRLPEKLKVFGHFDLVAGSTWPDDEEILSEVIEQLNLKTILAPHDVSPDNIARLIKSLKVPCVRLSELKTFDEKIKIIIVDSIGLLSVLYAIGEIAYIGGGFGKGIHNSLEAMAHGKPIIFGPNFQKFPEAVDMVASQGAWSIRNKSELISVITQLRLPGKKEEAGRKNDLYIKEHAGATKIISDYILKSIPYIA